MKHIKQEFSEGLGCSPGVDLGGGARPKLSLFRI